LEGPTPCRLAASVLASAVLMLTGPAAKALKLNTSESSRDLSTRANLFMVILRVWIECLEHRRGCSRLVETVSASVPMPGIREVRKRASELAGALGRRIPIGVLRRVARGRCPAGVAMQ